MAEYMIGYELSETYCQISYWSEEDKEPKTAETKLDHYQIPLMIGYNQNGWHIGKEAKKLYVLKEGYTESNLLIKAQSHEKVQFGENTYEAVWLLYKFVEESLKQFEQIHTLVFTTEKLNMELVRVLKGIGQRCGISKENIYVQDYKESFCSYMIYQPKELWQYEAALFYCNQQEVTAYMLRKIRTGYGKGKDGFITVDEVSHAKMEELASVYPIMNEEGAKEADVHFKTFVQGVFDKKLVSSVFLVGEGFEKDWYPQSLRFLCNGRRAFLGNNLYSKGACYHAYSKRMNFHNSFIYLDETRMLEQICFKMRTNGESQWFPMIPWGSRWYEADASYELLLENADDIEILVESLSGAKTRVETVSLDGLPNRTNYSLRLQINIMFLNENVCKISMKDIGFGEFYPASDFYIEKEIHLGGRNGEFHSLP